MQKKKMKKSRFSIFPIIICSFLAVISFHFLKNICNEVSTTLALSQELNETLQEKEDLEENKTELMEQKEKLQDDNYVESVVIGGHLFTRPDEQVFILPPLDEE